MLQQITSQFLTYENTATKVAMINFLEIKSKITLYNYQKHSKHSHQQLDTLVLSIKD